MILPPSPTGPAEAIKILPLPTPPGTPPSFDNESCETVWFPRPRQPNIQALCNSPLGSTRHRNVARAAVGSDQLNQQRLNARMKRAGGFVHIAESTPVETEQEDAYGRGSEATSRVIPSRPTPVA